MQELLDRYQFLNSPLDLFSEESPWGSDEAKADWNKTPRTTARFLPGYDWGSDKGFFDDLADKAERDFVGDYENSWMPTLDDNDLQKK